jgi:hypothetical protein
MLCIGIILKCLFSLLYEQLIVYLLDEKHFYMFQLSNINFKSLLRHNLDLFIIYLIEKIEHSTGVVVPSHQFSHDAQIIA